MLGGWMPRMPRPLDEVRWRTPQRTLSAAVWLALAAYLPALDRLASAERELEQAWAELAE